VATLFGSMNEVLRDAYGDIDSEEVRPLPPEQEETTFYIRDEDLGGLTGSMTTRSEFPYPQCWEALGLCGMLGNMAYLKAGGAAASEPVNFPAFKA
jgi:hypothetical protein